MSLSLTLSVLRKSPSFATFVQQQSVRNYAVRKYWNHQWRPGLAPKTFHCRCFCTPSDPKPPTLPRDRSQPTGSERIVGWRSIKISACFAAAMLAYLFYLERQKDKEIEKERMRSIGKAKIGGGFQLVDHNGVTRTESDFLGKWLLIYFGFTHCPDICPDEIAKLCKATDDLAKENIEVQPIFISVDPMRDTVPMVAKYCKEFSPKLLGLTGTIEQVSQCCKAYRVYFSAGPRDQEDDYIVDHTVIIYLVNPMGQFIDYFGATKSAEDIKTVVLFSAAKLAATTSKWF